jgi:hypothetical protein
MLYTGLGTSSCCSRSCNAFPTDVILSDGLLIGDHAVVLRPPQLRGLYDFGAYPLCNEPDVRARI